MHSAFDISVSGMVAQRARLDAISGNIANVSTTRNEAGEPEPYQPRFVVFETTEKDMPSGSAGVIVSHVGIEQREPLWRYEPGNPDAVQTGPHAGEVAYPNIDMTEEFVHALDATRAYEANVGVMEISKDLGRQTLRILA